MLSYILFITLIGLFAFAESSGFNDPLIKNGNGYLRYVVFFILLIFIGLRYKVGADWLQYYTYYENVETLDVIIFNAKNATYFYDHNWESGFKLLVATTKTLGIPFEGVVFMITSFNLYSLNRLLRNYVSSNTCIFLVMFLSLNMLREFDILRQSLAFYILLFSYQYINRSFLKYALICILAAMFHTSALIFLIVYPLFRLNIRRSFLIGTIILFVASLVLKLRILSMMVDIGEKVLPNSSATFLLHQIKLYLEFYPVQSNINFVTLLCLAFLICLIVWYKKIDFKEQKFITLFLIFVYISILFSEIGEVQSRFGYYFTVGLAYCTVWAAYLFRGYYRIVYVVFVIVYADIKVVLPLRLEATLLTYTPYKNFIFHMDKDPVTEREINSRHSKSQEKANDLFIENADN